MRWVKACTFGGLVIMSVDQVMLPEQFAEFAEFGTMNAMPS